MAENLLLAWDQIPSTALPEIVHWRKTGEWQDGVPSWASRFAAAIDTKAGSIRFKEELESWYVRKLEKTLEPFAEAGGELDPRRSGIAVTVESDKRERHYVTYDHLRAAARVLGHGLQKPEAKAEILGHFLAVDGSTVWQIRWQDPYRSAKPAWLLLRERPADGGEAGRMEALKYDGTVALRVTCEVGGAEPRGNVFDKVKLITDQGRRDAIGKLVRYGLKAGSSLKDGYERLAEADNLERRRRRIWTVVADIHLTQNGAPGDRLIRLRWNESPDGEKDMVFRITLDGVVHTLQGYQPFRVGGEWHVSEKGIPDAAAHKLVAGINSGGTRMLAEAIEAMGWNERMSVPVADRVWSDFTQ